MDISLFCSVGSYSVNTCLANTHYNLARLRCSAVVLSSGVNPAERSSTSLRVWTPSWSLAGLYNPRPSRIRLPPSPSPLLRGIACSLACTKRFTSYEVKSKEHSLWKFQFNMPTQAPNWAWVARVCVDMFSMAFAEGQTLRLCCPCRTKKRDPQKTIKQTKSGFYQKDFGQAEKQ